MAVYVLGPDPVFPPPWLAEPNGLLAVGGDLSPARLLEAYRNGIFPWYSEGDPILWFSPDPRMVLEPRGLRIDRGMRRTLARVRCEIRFDTAFDAVIAACAAVPRKGTAGTWLTPEMIEAYRRLHRLGYAHSAEAWEGDRLVGGVYGVALGGYFSGESMFHLRSGASLAALVTLIRRLADWHFLLFDCQLYSDHTARLGATLWPRSRFLDRLSEALEASGRPGPWGSRCTSPSQN